MDDEAVAYVCGECEDVRAAHWQPTFCGRCRARFDLGAPCALVRLELGVTTSGGALELAPAYRVDVHGEWSAEARERVERMFGAQHCDAPASKATVPSHERTRARRDS
jgi:hypothetical protein